MAIVQRTRSNVSKIPSPVAFADLLERITDRGVELDGESKLTAIEDPNNSQLLAWANRPVLVPGLNGAPSRRRGAPLAKGGR